MSQSQGTTVVTQISTTQALPPAQGTTQAGNPELAKQGSSNQVNPAQQSQPTTTSTTTNQTQGTQQTQSNQTVVQPSQPKPEVLSAQFGGLRDINWELKAPEELSADKLKNTEGSKFSKHRLEVVKGLEKSCLSHENEFVHKEKHFLDRGSNQLEKILADNKTKLDEETQLMIKLQDELNQFGPQKEKSQKELGEIEEVIKNMEKQITVDKNDLLGVAAKKLDIVKKIDPNELKKIKIKNEKSSTHFLFQWLLIVVYGENISKYDWSNFKAQAFKKDGGADFLSRMNGFNFAKQKVDPVATKKVLDKRDEIIKEVEGKGVNPSVKAVFEYIELVKKVSDDLDDIRITEGKMAEKKQDLDKKRNKHGEILSKIEAFESKLTIVKKYHSAMEKIRQLALDSQKLIQNRNKGQNAYLSKHGGSEPEDQRKEEEAEVNRQKQRELEKEKAAKLAREQEAAAKLAAEKAAAEKLAAEKSGDKKTETQASTQTQNQTQGQATTTPATTTGPQATNTAQTQQGASTDQVKTTTTGDVKTDAVVVKVQDEDNFGGDDPKNPKKEKKQVHSAGLTEFNETPIAENKEGGCQGCNIF